MNQNKKRLTTPSHLLKGSQFFEILNPFLTSKSSLLMKIGVGLETGWLLLFSFFWITESAQFLDLPTVSFGEEANLKKETTGLEHVFTDVWVPFFFG